MQQPTPIRCILFDLDGTLLPMDQEVFVKTYFAGLSRAASPHGYEAEALIKTIWAGTAAMVKNDGEKTNEEVFWETFVQAFGPASRRDIAMFDAFYEHDFPSIRHVCGHDPRVPRLIRSLREADIPLVLATNPIFPQIATYHRMRWAGLSPDDFLFCTTYETSRHCKPNPAYYRDILARLDVSAEECLMVGNDVDEDMVAKTLGMQVFLLTDCLINKHGQDISRYPHGDITALEAHIRSHIHIPLGGHT